MDVWVTSFPARAGKWKISKRRPASQAVLQRSGDLLSHAGPHDAVRRGSKRARREHSCIECRPPVLRDYGCWTRLPGRRIARWGTLPCGCLFRRDDDAADARGRLAIRTQTLAGDLTVLRVSHRRAAILWRTVRAGSGDVVVALTGDRDTRMANRPGVDVSEDDEDGAGTRD